MTFEETNRLRKHKGFRELSRHEHERIHSRYSIDVEDEIEARNLVSELLGFAAGELLNEAITNVPGFDGDGGGSFGGGGADASW
jgi:hypothetical protein